MAMPVHLRVEDMIFTRTVQDDIERELFSHLGEIGILESKSAIIDASHGGSPFSPNGRCSPPRKDPGAQYRLAKQRFSEVSAEQSFILLAIPLLVREIVLDAPSVVDIEHGTA